MKASFMSPLESENVLQDDVDQWRTLVCYLKIFKSIICDYR